MAQFHATVAVDRWVIKGRLHMTSNKTVKEFLHANRDFFPIADAKVVDAESPGKHEQLNVAIVNRARVSIMEINELSDSDLGSAPLETGQQLGDLPLSAL